MYTIENADLKTSKKLKKCQKCRSLTPRTCEQCHQAFYCDEACQAKDWPLHQFYCRLPFPAKEIGEKSVYGILLTEDADNPVVVKYQIRWK